LKRDRFGRHAVERRGAGGDRTDDAKRYEFGDPFLLDLKETLMNALERQGPGTPVRLTPDDFEVFRTELSTQAATVVMLDMSRSMIFNGCFLAAKKVTLALNASSAVSFRATSSTSWASPCTRASSEPSSSRGLHSSEWSSRHQHARRLPARARLLGRQKGGNKQIIMVTDGEPTAHMEGLEAEFAYPPTRRTIQETLKEVQRCTREGINPSTPSCSSAARC
jgi:uncharacterized protein with von Willebrand factor type A (vWA) domain